MKLTTNYSLKKPNGSDVVNIDDFNYNADMIDTKIKAVENQSNTNKTNISSLQSQISTNKTNISNLDNSYNTLNNWVQGLNDSLYTANNNIGQLQTQVSNGQNHKLTQDNGLSIRLNNGTDFNSITKNGTYHADTPVNAPFSNGWFIVEHLTGADDTNNWAMQRALDIYSGKYFIRNKSAGYWSAWREL